MSRLPVVDAKASRSLNMTGKSVVLSLLVVLARSAQRVGWEHRKVATELIICRLPSRLRWPWRSLVTARLHHAGTLEQNAIEATFKYSSPDKLE